MLLRFLLLGFSELQQSLYVPVIDAFSRVVSSLISTTSAYLRTQHLPSAFSKQIVESLIIHRAPKGNDTTKQKSKAQFKHLSLAKCHKENSKKTAFQNGHALLNTFLAACNPIQDTCENHN